MKKLGFSLVLVFIMLLLIPFADRLALCPSQPGKAWCYMFAHANLIHWAFNSWCLIMLHNILNVHRCLAAYLSAVVVGIVYAAVPCCSATGLPVLGFSVILFWFFGYLIPYYWHRRRLTVLILGCYLLVGLFIPRLAGSFHIFLCLMGLICYYIEYLVRRILIFILDEF